MQGNSATITFATSGFTGKITKINGSEFSREALPDDDLSTTENKTFVPAVLAEAGEFEIEFYFDPDVRPDHTAPAETITITFPLPSGKTTAANVAGTGFITKVSSADLENNALMIGKATIRWDGKTGPAWTAST